MRLAHEHYVDLMRVIIDGPCPHKNKPEYEKLITEAAEKFWMMKNKRKGK